MPGKVRKGLFSGKLENFFSAFGKIICFSQTEVKSSKLVSNLSLQDATISGNQKNSGMLGNKRSCQVNQGKVRGKLD